MQRNQRTVSRQPVVSIFGKKKKTHPQQIETLQHVYSVERVECQRSSRKTFIFCLFRAHSHQMLLASRECMPRRRSGCRSGLGNGVGVPGLSSGASSVLCERTGRKTSREASYLMKC